MHDQADQLRKLVRASVDTRRELAPGAAVIAVSGAQVGLGATSVACGLARELAALDKRVALVDANLAAPTIAEAMNAKPHGTLADVLAGRRRAVEVLAPAGDNIHILAGDAALPDIPLNAEALERFRSELAALSRQVDVVLIDAGAGMNPWIDSLWQLAGRVLLAMTPTPAAVVDAYAALKLSRYERLAGNLQLVITQCDAAADAARIHAGFSATCQRFLGHDVKAPAVLPSMAAPGDVAYQRSLRLLAADLACEFRALAVRIASPRATNHRFFQGTRRGELSAVAPNNGTSPQADS